MTYEVTFQNSWVFKNTFLGSGKDLLQFIIMQLQFKPIEEFSSVSFCLLQQLWLEMHPF